MLDKIKEIDKQISFSMLKHYKHTKLNKIMKTISYCGNLGVIWLIVIAIMYYYKPTRHVSIYVLLAIIFATLAGQITIKSIVKRPRPCHTYPEVNILLPVPTDLSFPSGHTTSSFACSTVLFIFFPILGIIAYTWAALTGFSRIYLFVHYLSDVLTGAVLGTIIGYLVTFL